MKKKKTFVIAPVGISSVMVIFAVLCLAVLAMLSVSTVNAHIRLADSSRVAITGYYQADQAAEEILAQLRGGQIPQGVRRQGQEFSYDCPISATQTLAVTVKVEGTQYQILRWQAVSMLEWEAEEKLPVWTGTGS